MIWAIGCGGFMPLEPPSVLLQGFGPFCLGTLFARFGLWIATNMATAGPKHPQEFPWASGGGGWQWGAAKPMSGPSRAHETAISPSGLPSGEKNTASRETSEQSENLSHCEWPLS